MSKLKIWQWVVLVIFGLGLLGSVLPEQKTTDGTETMSPAVLLWIPVVVLPIYLVARARKKKRATIDAAQPSAEKLQKEIVEIKEKVSKRCFPWSSCSTRPSNWKSKYKKVFFRRKEKG